MPAMSSLRSPRRTTTRWEPSRCFATDPPGQVLASARYWAWLAGQLVSTPLGSRRVSSSEGAHNTNDIA